MKIAQLSLSLFGILLDERDFDALGISDIATDNRQ